MSTTQRPVSVESLSVVTLAVEDQAAALDWYVERLGFEIQADAPFEMAGREGRWLTVAPPGNTEVEIALVELDPDLYDGPMIDRLRAMHGTDTMWTFTTPDLDAAVEDLRENGVAVDDDIRETPWGRFAMFHDLDGNALQLYEPADEPA